jgi:hypothetical protein
MRFTIKDFGNALKNGPYTSVGSYPVYFVTDDGGALSFSTAWEERAQIADAINNSENNGWRVVGMDVNWEDSELYDAHTSERIESAYAEDDAKGEPAKIPESYKKWQEGHRMRGLGAYPERIGDYPPPKFSLSQPNAVETAAAALRGYRGKQPRRWVYGQLRRNGWSPEDAEFLLTQHFDKSERLGEWEGEFKSLTYGKLPSKDEFVKRTAGHYPYPMELVDKNEIKVIEEAGLLDVDGVEEFYTGSHKFGIRVKNAEVMYRFLSALKKAYETSATEDPKADAAGNLASSIFYTLGYEWV